MNRFRLSVFSALAIASLCALGGARDARACAVLTPDQTLPVTGHKMILSLSMSQTTLWDQFAYTGDPASFGWILPIQGQVEVGVSSDALFDAFGKVTAPQVYAPAVCPNSCDNGGTGGGGGGSFGGDVTVIAHEQVGPYDTVQLASGDANALKNWLQTNGFPIPAAVQPVFDAYVSEGSGFLAIKLLPGVGTEAVQPVRVTMPGAAPSVPIRLLAAGTGDLTQVTLWIVSDGKYLPSNAPVVRILSDDLTWDFATNTSDYATVRADKLAASGGLAYLVEQSQQYSASTFTDPIDAFVLLDPVKSGYGKNPSEAQTNSAADEDKMFGPFVTAPWVTRLSADLSRPALAKDLLLTAPATQNTEDGVYFPTAYVNASECPPDPCGGSGGTATGGAGGTGGSGTGGSGMGAGGSGAGGSSGGNGQGGNTDDGGTSDCSCRLPGSPSPSGAGGAFGLALALGLASRRARRRVPLGRPR